MQYYNLDNGYIVARGNDFLSISFKVMSNNCVKISDFSACSQEKDISLTEDVEKVSILPSERTMNQVRR